MIPAARLHPLDIHHQLDWLQEAWTGEPEDAMTRRLWRLHDMLFDMPEPQRSRALVVWRDLQKARLSRTVSWQQRIVQLRIIANEWRI